MAVSQLEAASRPLARNEATLKALAQAKEALIAYAITYRDKHPDGTNKTTDVFGYLPCPDSTGNGSADATQSATGCGDFVPASGTGGTDQVVVGLLPTTELGLGDLRDHASECLWYAVSPRHKAINANPKPQPLNWDTRGQIRILDSDGVTVLANPENGSDGGAIAVIFAAGPPVSNQLRQPVAGIACGINSRTAWNKYLESVALDSSGNFASSETAPLVVTKGRVGDATNNDQIAWITAKEIFDRIVTRPDFKNPASAGPPGQINTLGSSIITKLETTILNDLKNLTSTTPVPSRQDGYQQFGSKLIGDLPTLALTNYDTYLSHWKDQYRYVRCSPLTTPCLKVDGQDCRGALFFAGRAASDGARLVAEKAPAPYASYAYPALGNLLANYFEPATSGGAHDVLTASSTVFTNSGGNEYSGATASSRSRDVGICIFPGAFVSFAQDIASFQTGTVTTGTTVASVSTSAKTIRLGYTGSSPGSGSGCSWYPSALPFGSAVRLYFRFQLVSKGNGFTVALADGASNNPASSSPIMCGQASNTRLGYAGSPDGTSAGIKAPKLGIEFDTRYDASRTDPHSDHMAFLFWGGSGDSGVGGSGSDDNTHYIGTGGVAISAASWSSGTLMFTTRSAHGLSAGQTVLVSGISPASYNGTHSILAAGLTTTQFAVSLASAPGAYASGGIARATSSGAAPRNPRIATALRSIGIADASWSFFSSRVTITTSSNHGLSAGQKVYVSGNSPSGYNGVFTVLSSGLLANQFRYTLTTNPGAWTAAGNVVSGSEISGLAWAGGTATATTPAAHGLTTGPGYTYSTYGMTPGTFGVSTTLASLDSTHFTYALGSDPNGTFATETPAGMARVNTGDAYLPRSAFPLNTASLPCNGTCEQDTVIHVRLDISRTYDATNNIAVLNMKAYIGDTFDLVDACGSAEFQDLSRDLAEVCRNPNTLITNRGVTLQQDSIPIRALATVSGAAWDSGTNRVTVTTSATHGLVNNSTITISGATPTAYNGTYPVTVTSANTFTYLLNNNPGSWTSGGSIEPLATFFLGFTNARNSSNTGENQDIRISNLLMRSY